MMIDYQRTIDDIQSILYSGGTLQLDALSTLSSAYTRACETANERLRECQELLRKGLRAEAIQRCEVEPNLLDVANTLDFPERAQWCSILRDSKLPVPPELLVDVAADLNAAYAQEQPLTELMRRHRLLALARAPLRQRISALRQITEADPENPIWEADLKIYERVRHDQIQSALAAAGRQRDVEALATLEREVQDPDWRESPPATLVRGVFQAMIAARKSRARDQLAALVPELTAAHSQMDYTAACECRERWLAAAQDFELAPDDPLAQSAASVFDWLESEDEKHESRRAFASTVHELEQALDANAPQVELERIHARLPQFDQQVPAALEHRLQSRLDSLVLHAARRSKLILVATIGVLLLTAALTGVLIVRQVRSQKVAGYAAALEQLLNEGKLAEAEEYWTNLDAKEPSSSKEPQLAELKVRLDGLIKTELDRRTSFAQAVNAARDSGLDQPDQRSLDESKRLAKTDGDRRQIFELERKIAAHRREMNRQRDEKFMARIDELKDPFARLDKGELLGYESRLAAVNNLLIRVASLEREGTDCSAEVRANLTPMKVKLESLKRGEMEKDRIEAQLKRISDAVGNHQSFRDELLKYASEFPGTARAETFSAIAKKEFPLWESIAAWDPLVRQWSNEDATKLSSPEATAQIAKAKSLLTEYKLFPDAGVVEQRLPYLDAIARREGSSGRIEEELDRALKFYFVDNVYVVHAKDGTRYYCKEKPQGNTIKYLVDNNQNTPAKIKFLPPDAAEPAVKAPQSVESSNAQALLIGLTNENWESTFLKILGRIYANDQMDAIVKVQLMDAVLGVGCKGSRCLETAFARQFVELNKASERVKDVDWVGPKNNDAQAPRAEVENLLRSLGPGLSAAAKQATGEVKELRKSPLEHRYQWVGWLHRDTADRWRFAAGTQTLPVAAELCILSLSDAPGDAAAVAAIGKLDGKSPSITSNDAKLLVEGRPVYARVPLDLAR